MSPESGWVLCGAEGVESWGGEVWVKMLGDKGVNADA